MSTIVGAFPVNRGNLSGVLLTQRSNTGPIPDGSPSPGGAWQPLDGTLTALAGLTSPAFVVMTAADTAALRTLTLSAEADAFLALTNPAGVAGNPLFDLDTQLANRVFAGPGAGAAAKPTFRALVAADIPGGLGYGNVDGPSASIDNHIVTWDGTSGTLIQDGAGMTAIAESASLSAITADGAGADIAIRIRPKGAELIQLGPDTYGPWGSSYDLGIEQIKLLCTGDYNYGFYQEIYGPDIAGAHTYGMQFFAATQGAGSANNLYGVVGVDGSSASYLPAGRSVQYASGGQFAVNNFGAGTIDVAYGVFSLVDRFAGNVPDATAVWGEIRRLAGTNGVGVGRAFHALKSNAQVLALYTSYWADDNTGKATNGYFLWSDSPGVYRVKDDGVMAYYNPAFTKYTPGAANYERVVQQWNSSVAEIGTEAGGTGVQRALRLLGAGVGIPSRLGVGAAAHASIPLLVAGQTTLASSAFGTPLLLLSGADGVNPQLGIDGFGALPQLLMRRANGTAASPSNLALNDVIFTFAGAGYGASAYQGTKVAFDLLAAEAWTTTFGTLMTFRTTLIGASTVAERFRITGLGHLKATGAICLGAYTVATLPTGIDAYSFAFVTDATLTAITGLGLAPVGGGANKVPVYTTDGTNWLML